MTNEEIAVKFAEHHKEIGSAKHRINELEEQNKSIQDLVLSVRELAINMKNMIEEQHNQGERLVDLEKEPSALLAQIKIAIVTALASSLITAVVGAILLTIN